MEKEQEEVHFKICNSVLKLEVNKGHLKWTISEIAKDSDITRSLIYYYFGKEKKVILEEAFRYMTEVFFNISDEKKLGVVKRMEKVLTRLQDMPYAFILFFLERRKDNEIGKLIRSSEEKLFKRLQDDYPDLSEKEILKIYLLELGSIAYGIEPKEAASIF